MILIYGIIQLFVLLLSYLIFTYIYKEEEKEIIDSKTNTNNLIEKKKKKIGLLTNEIPPIIYGGVSTWIVNYIKMFEEDDNFEIIPIFLAYADKDRIKEIDGKYENLRIVYNKQDIINSFKDIDICVNNLWIALDTIKMIVDTYPEIIMISVCHSLIKMEHLTNLGSMYTNNFYEQEITFQCSDFVILISEAEKNYYITFGYNKYKAKPVVIYNSYKPKFDNIKLKINYKNNNIGYIGRHVPRKRPELPIFAVKKNKNKNVEVWNMGVDYKNGSNEYWDVLKELFKDQLNIIPFSSDKKLKKKFWNKVGVNCITGIYEPFGYTICETLDRRVPAIVQNIDGPKEIIGQFKNSVYMYEVEKNNWEKDINNVSDAMKKFWSTSPKNREINAEKARKALDKFRPEAIKEKWKDLFSECLSDEYKNKRISNKKLKKFGKMLKISSYDCIPILKEYFKKIISPKKKSENNIN
jgi:glycosyltransferase involved in cell wall biosynthesis